MLFFPPKTAFLPVTSTACLAWVANTICLAVTDRIKPFSLARQPHGASRGVGDFHVALGLQG